MEKFLKPEMEVIEFDTEDILTSSCPAVADVTVDDYGCGELEDCPGYNFNERF